MTQKIYERKGTVCDGNAKKGGMHETEDLADVINSPPSVRRTGTGTIPTARMQFMTMFRFV